MVENLIAVQEQGARLGTALQRRSYTLHHAAVLFFQPGAAAGRVFHVFAAADQHLFLRVQNFVQVGSDARIIEVLVADRTERPFANRTWPFIRQLAWVNGGQGLAISARDQDTGAYHVWQVPRSNGSARKITDGLTGSGAGNRLPRRP